jgi:bifunctional non-homologous end joining protein LigD
MGLETYRKKRDFAVTREPAARAAAPEAPAEGRLFVVQKHGARRLHYDLRLEHKGVLLSWAVPKGPSLNPNDRNLAVRTEDHPLDYHEFEGAIPEGQYGAGEMLVWDRGQWLPDGDVDKALKRGKLRFALDGERLHGEWLLVRIKDDKSSKENWLLRKVDDEYADQDEPVTERHQSSIDTGRTLAQIAREEGGDGRGWFSLPQAARKKTIPKTLKPVLCTAVTAAPTGDDWLHEVKFDGYRVLIHLNNGKARCLTRNGHDWTDRFRRIADAATNFPAESAILDGEVVAQRENGEISFQLLQQQFKAGSRARLLIYVFDLPYLEGHDLMQAPLVERKKLLAERLAAMDADADATMRYSDHIIGSGEAVAAQACQQKLEGIICKKVDSPYRSGRGRDWVKVKCIRRQEFAIAGYTPPRGSRSGFGSLVLVSSGNGAWRYHGKVGTGFDDEQLRDLKKLLDQRRVDTLDIENLPRGEGRDVAWAKPELVAEVKFTEQTSDGRLRHPVFVALREDKPAGAIKMETPEAPPPKSTRKGSKRRTSKAAASEDGSPRTKPPKRAPAKRSVRSGGSKSDMHILGVKLTNPDRVLYPDQGLTKRELAEYYEQNADWALPYIADRPLALVRCPQGEGEECFFQKHAVDALPPQLRAVDVSANGGDEKPHITIADAAGLVALAQIGTLEIHTWGCRTDDVEKPDQMIFDLDPDPSVDWADVITAGRQVKDVLKTLELTSFVKLTGGKGLHVVVPLERRNSWDEVKGFARSVALFMQRHQPKRYIAVMTKSKRKGKIFVDYLRNGRGATAIAAYSTRARSGAPVATPIRWDELTPRRRPNDYTITNIRARLSRLRDDPWADFAGQKQWLTKERRQALSDIVGD